jgi:hypothetical protein
MKDPEMRLKEGIEEEEEEEERKRERGERRDVL